MRKIRFVFVLVTSFLFLSFFVSASSINAASVSGFKFEDLDKDGEWDSSEPKLGGWAIQLFTIDINERPYEPSNPALGPQIDQQLTADITGEYSFQLSPGQYAVCEELKSGWVQTFPGKCHLVILSGDEVINGNNFGNFQLASISGIKWNDMNRDG